MSRTTAVLGAAMASFALMTGSAGAGAQPPALRIVVLEGEDAVNVIQQKTAVAPVIEVRDRNDLPVAGAVVRFAVSRGRATFNGARALSVTTNAAGRAIATGLTPTGSGALQISATATFQGQTAAITIAQTNVMTSAAASGAAGGSAGGGGAGAGGTSAGASGAASGGGGLSATTVAVVSGAAIGGAVVAKEVLAGAKSEVYQGSYSGNVNVAFPPALSFCSRTIAHEGTVKIDVLINDDGTVAGGVGTVNGTMRMASFSGPQICAITTATQPHGESGTMTGARSAMTFSGSHPGAPGVTVTFEFTGALNGEAVTGTLTFVLTGGDGSVDRGVFPMTLQKQQ